MEIQFKDIEKIDEVGIHTKNSNVFNFSDFKEVHSPDIFENKCIGERDMLSEDPYMKFYMGDEELVIKFNGVDSGGASIKFFMILGKLGYCTFDLS